MLSGIAFGLAVTGVIYLIYWSITNDDVGSVNEQKGIVRMRKITESNSDHGNTKRISGRK